MSASLLSICQCVPKWRITSFNTTWSTHKKHVVLGLTPNLVGSVKCPQICISTGFPGDSYSREILRPPRLESCCSKNSPRTCSVDIPRVLVRNAESQTLPHTYCIRICILVAYPKIGVYPKSVKH